MYKLGLFKKRQQWYKSDLFTQIYLFFSLFILFRQYLNFSRISLQSDVVAKLIILCKHILNKTNENKNDEIKSRILAAQ